MKWAGTQFFFPTRLYRHHWMIRDLAGGSVSSQGSQASSGGQRRLWSDCADAQSDLSLRCAHMQSCRKYCGPAENYKRAATIEMGHWAYDKKLCWINMCICTVWSEYWQNLKGKRNVGEKCIWDKIFWQIMHFDVNLIKIRQKLIPLSKASPLWIFKDV